MNHFRLNGLIAAAITPMHSDGSVDFESIATIANRLIDRGVKGLYVCGSTGEGVSLSSGERKDVAAEYVRATASRVPVIVQVGHNSLTEAQELASHAAEIGADVISATCPSYFPIHSESELVASMFKLASGAPELPFYYYHIPALTGSRIDIVRFLKLAEDRIQNLVGLKYTNTLLHEFQSCRALDSGRFDVVWGCDEMLLGALATGAQAAIGSTYNIAAPLYNEIIQAVERCDFQSARQLQLKSIEMIRVMYGYGFQSALKAVMTRLGMKSGPCRLPIKPLTAGETESLHHDLETIGFYRWCGMN